ncbi:MAG: tRNA pseudouridine(55) synthase TruB, partial [Eubacterium sp.]|nr:tRNA pseudouridine(55) synthase TruB [Eubacterium sp.]
MTGIICINKPSDITSFGVCSRVRYATGEKKCGHAGTLDPMATGVLPVLLGGATKFLDFLPESDKAYKAEFMLGTVTDTLDITGKVIEKNSVNADYKAVAEAAESFLGTIMQTPPMYSAVSVGGKRLYELARQGIEIERQSREVEIKRIRVEQISNVEYSIEVLCSKGTYVRTLIDDIGKKLGCGAVMTKLCRTLACGFPIEKCVSLDEILKRKEENASFDDLLIPVDKALSPYGRIAVTSAQSIRFKNGGA